MRLPRNEVRLGRDIVREDGQKLARLEVELLHRERGVDFYRCVMKNCEDKFMGAHYPTMLKATRRHGVDPEQMMTAFIEDLLAPEGSRALVDLNEACRNWAAIYQGELSGVLQNVMAELKAGQELDW